MVSTRHTYYRADDSQGVDLQNYRTYSYHIKHTCENCVHNMVSPEGQAHIVATSRQKDNHTPY